MSLAIQRVLRLGDGSNARCVVVRELTVAEFRAWLIESATEKPRDALLALLVEDADSADLLHFTDLTRADLEALAPSEIRRVWDEVREVNRDFFAVLGRLATNRPSDSEPTSNSPA